MLCFHSCPPFFIITILHPFGAIILPLLSTKASPVSSTLYRIKQRVVGTVVIGILSFFGILVRILAARAPFLNAIQIHECLVFHVVPELLTRRALFSVTVV